MDRKQRDELIDQYKDGYRVVAEALAGATDEELDAHPAPGKWTAREIVHHLADSEMTSAIRLRLLIATDNPAIAGYDQDEFAKRLHYDRPIAASLDAFKAARRTTAEILDRLSETEWLREGTHTEHGRYSVQRWLEIYAAHAHEHADRFSSRARSASSERSSGDALSVLSDMTRPRGRCCGRASSQYSRNSWRSRVELRDARFPRSRDLFALAPASICSRSSADPARMSNGSFSCSYS